MIACSSYRLRKKGARNDRQGFAESRQQLTQRHSDSSSLGGSSEPVRVVCGVWSQSRVCLIVRDCKTTRLYICKDRYIFTNNGAQENAWIVESWRENDGQHTLTQVQ